ncbi:hypothetical protein F4001_02285 [Candidatus Poribacteria bacterium]|nr:hypothetical protein [Candidatus Poribacteria bacterium]
MKDQQDIIKDQLKSLRSRRRTQALIHKTAQAFCLCLFILALLSIAVRFLSFPISTLFATLSVILISLIVGIYLGFRQRIPMIDMLRYVDNHLKLKARLTTAWEMMQIDRQDELTQLQIDDTVKSIANKELSKCIPLTVPSILKWIPIPLLIIGLSFAIPRQYSVPLPPTITEGEAINNAIKALTNELEQVVDSNLRENIKDTIEKLQHVKDVPTAHQNLQTLNDEVRKQKSALPDDSTITQAMQATQHFKDMDTTALAHELDSISKQDELTPELRAEIEKLLNRLAETVPHGELSQTLDSIQGKPVTTDILKEIVRQLNKLDQLNRLEAQITESRKNIALASIDTYLSDRSFACSDSNPGQETGNQETQGKQVQPDDPQLSTTNDDTSSQTTNNNTAKPLTGDENPTQQTNGKEFRINSEVASETQRTTRVYAGNTGNGGDEPEYIQFEDVVLNAQREYAQAIENNRIPLRFRSQIQNYLKALTEVNEKSNEQ